jgi:hypothetical protein
MAIKRRSSLPLVIENLMINIAAFECTWPAYRCYQSGNKYPDSEPNPKYAMTFF